MTTETRVPSAKISEKFDFILKNPYGLQEARGEKAQALVGEWVLVRGRYPSSILLAFVEKLDGRGILHTTQGRFSTKQRTICSTQKNDQGDYVRMYHLEDSYKGAVASVQQAEKYSREAQKRDLQSLISKIDPHAGETLITELIDIIKAKTNATN